MTKTKTKTKARAVLVTTEHRGVFFGRTLNSRGKVIVLQGARNCIYWSQDVGGFLGLASRGPTANCRIGAVAPLVELRGVTSVSDVTPEATRAWDTAPCVS